MGKRRKKIYHPHQPLLKGSKIHWKREPAPLHRALGKWPKSLTIFFYFFGDLTCQQMENVSIIHADGTFKIVPKKFYQLLIIHCVFSDFLIPVFYAVMTSKSRLLYDALFLSIRNLLRKFNARHPNFWVFINKLHEIIKSYCVELKQIENGQKTRRRKAKFSKAVDSAIRDAEEKLQNERISTTEFLIRVGGATERSFRKIELVKEVEEGKKLMLPMILMMMIIMIVLIYFVKRIMKKITICAQAVMRNLLPILFNHADI